MAWASERRRRSKLWTVCWRCWNPTRLTTLGKTVDADQNRSAFKRVAQFLPCAGKQAAVGTRRLLHVGFGVPPWSLQSSAAWSSSGLAQGAASGRRHAGTRFHDARTNGHSGLTAANPGLLLPNNDRVECCPSPGGSADDTNGDSRHPRMTVRSIVREDRRPAFARATPVDPSTI